MLERKLTEVEKEEFTKKIIDDLEQRHLKLYGKQAKTEKTNCIISVTLSVRIVVTPSEKSI